MAALDFPNPPLTVGQQYAAPNGVTYQWDGAAWVVTGGPPGQLWTGAGATLTPTDATKIVAVPGAASGEAMRFGTLTTKGRLLGSIGTTVGAYLTLNTNYAGTQDDTTKPSWWLTLDGTAATGDVFAVARQPPGSTASTGLFWVMSNGDLRWGTNPIKGRLYPPPASGGDQGGLYLAANTTYLQTKDDNTKPAWYFLLNPTGDVARLLRDPPGSTVTAIISTFDNLGNLTITGPTGTKSTGTTWANPSDRRLKEDIADYTTGLESIVALRPRTFLYNGKGGSQTGLRGYGYIADEVEPVMPEMLRVTRAKLTPEDEAETDIQTLDTSNVILALVNAVKELAARVTALDAHA